MNRFKNIHELIYKNKYHILSILLIFTSYFFSLIIFKEVIVASHDNLDNQDMIAKMGVYCCLLVY